MSTARNIPNDRGLTLRMFITGLMIVLLYGAVIGLLIAVGISYAVVLVIAAGPSSSSSTGSRTRSPSTAWAGGS